MADVYRWRVFVCKTYGNTVEPWRTTERGDGDDSVEQANAVLATWGHPQPDGFPVRVGIDRADGNFWVYEIDSTQPDVRDEVASQLVGTELTGAHLILRARRTQRSVVCDQLTRNEVEAISRYAGEVRDVVKWWDRYDPPDDLLSCAYFCRTLGNTLEPWYKPWMLPDDEGGLASAHAVLEIWRVPGALGPLEPPQPEGYPHPVIAEGVAPGYWVYSVNSPFPDARDDVASRLTGVDLTGTHVILRMHGARIGLMTDVNVKMFKRYAENVYMCRNWAGVYPDFYNPEVREYMCRTWGTTVEPWRIPPQTWPDTRDNRNIAAEVKAEWGPLLETEGYPYRIFADDELFGEWWVYQANGIDDDDTYDVTAIDAVASVLAGVELTGAHMIVRVKGPNEFMLLSRNDIDVVLLNTLGERAVVRDVKDWTTHYAPLVAPDMDVADRIGWRRIQQE